MTRVTNWEMRFIETLQKHLDIPFEYGVSDCYMMCAEIAEAITGQFPHKTGRGYRTKSGAGRKLRAQGFETVDDAWAAVYREIPISLIQRGDIAIIDTPEGPGGAVWDGRNIIAKNADGQILRLPMTIVKKAYRVE